MKRKKKTPFIFILPPLLIRAVCDKLLIIMYVDSCRLSLHSCHTYDESCTDGESVIVHTYYLPSYLELLYCTYLGIYIVLQLSKVPQVHIIPTYLPTVDNKRFFLPHKHAHVQTDQGGAITPPCPIVWSGRSPLACPSI